MSGNIGKFFKGAFAGAAVALTAGGLASIVKGSLDAAGGIGELADQLGVGTDALQGYQYAATQTGVKQDEIQKGLQNLTREIGKATEGNKQAIDSFNNLGVNILDANGKVRTTENVFRDIANQIALIPEPSKQAAAAAGVFGDRLGQKLIPLLKGGAAGLDAFVAKARQMGLVLSAEDIKRADDAADAIAELERQWAKLAQTVITSGLAEFLTDAAKGFQRIIAGSSDQLSFAEKLLRIETEIAQIEERRANPSKLGRRSTQGRDEQRLAQLQAERDQLLSSRPNPSDFANADTGGVSNPPPKKTGPDPLDRFFTASVKRKAALEAEAQTYKKSVFEQEKLKFTMEAEAIAKENNIPITDELRKKIDALGTAYATAAAVVKEGLVAQDQIDELNHAIDGLERLATAYGESEEAGKAMEAELQAESAARRNQAVNIEELTGKLDDERRARERVQAIRTLGSINQETRDIYALSEALSRATLVWNEYTGAYEVNDREARILAETQRLLAHNTEISAEAARNAAEAHVDAQDAMKKTGDQAARTANDMNASSYAVKGFFSELIDGAIDSKNALEVLSDALGNLGRRLLDIAANQIFDSLVGSLGGGLGGLLGAGAGAAASATPIMDSLAASGAFLLHDGGVVGQDGKSQMRARRGTSLRGNEVVSVLQKGEEVITPADPRHRRNLSKYHTGGIAGRIPDINIPRAAQIGRMPMAQIPAPQVNSSTKIVNTFDSTSFLSEAVTKKDGETVLMNFVSANRQRIRATLGV